MTKKLSKPCIKCTHWDGACSKGHKPRFFRDGGLRRVCDDFSTEKAPAHKPHWLDNFMKIFGLGRA